MGKDLSVTPGIILLIILINTIGFFFFSADQLLVLQKPSTDGKTMIPNVQSIDEVEKLTGALRRIDVGKTVLEHPNDYCLLCTQTTNRCFHATHAYTGVPCAAYSEYIRYVPYQVHIPFQSCLCLCLWALGHTGFRKNPFRSKKKISMKKSKCTFV